MTIDPLCTQKATPSPLADFPFTADWLRERNFPRDLLPPIDQQLSHRLAHLADHSWQPWTNEEVIQLRDFNLSFGNTPGAPFADHLTRPDSLVIVTGQQPNFLASPLYILHKALSACAWARRLSADTGRPVVPVFWVASNDDDFSELRHAWHVAHDGTLVDVGAGLSRGEGLYTGSPAYLWNFQESFHRLAKNLYRVFHDWPQGDVVSRWLTDSLRHYNTIEKNFCYLLTQLLGPENPILFVTPRLESFRRRQVPIFTRDINRHAEFNETVTRRAHQMEAAGYNVPLTREPEALNFFWIHDRLRHRLVRQPDSTITATNPRRRAEVRRFTDSELLALLELDPGVFSPNVITRPILQDVALPAAAYIAGPGEFAYLAQLDGVYDLAGNSRAAVIPRTLVTIELGDHETICRQTAPESILRQKGRPGIELLRHVEDLLTGTEAQIETLRISAKGMVPAVGKAIDKTERHLLYGIDQLKRRLARQAAPDEWNSAARLYSLATPGGGSQERRLAPWSFVKPGDWPALATHLKSAVDYASTTPQAAPLPPWLREPQKV